MKIIMMCIMVAGHHYQPHGHYRTWSQCNASAKHIERQLVSLKDRRQPLCWCQRQYLKLQGED